MATQNDTFTLTLGGISESGEFCQLPVELLQMILKLLHPWDTFDLRLVNSLWRDLTSSNLREQGPILRLVCALTHDGPIHRCQHPSMTLDTLNETLITAQNLDTLVHFPCHSLRLHGVNLSMPVVQTLFDLYGPYLRSLSLDACASTMEGNVLTVLRRLLVEQAPNLMEFSMHNHWAMEENGGFHQQHQTPRSRIIFLATMGPTLSSQNGDGDSAGSAAGPILFPPNCSLTLPHLKKLGFGLTPFDQRTLEQILELAVNLQTCHFWTFGPAFSIEKFRAKNKIHTIRQLMLNLVPYKFDFFDRLSSSNVQLTSLELSLDYIFERKSDPQICQRAAAIINKIFKSSRSTLRKIKEFQPLGYLPVVMPASFENLDSLYLTNNFFEIPNNIPIFEPMFPPFLENHRRLHLASTFPKLKFVSMAFIKIVGPGGEVMAGHEFWGKYFPLNLTENAFFTVKKLRTHALPADYLPGMAALFPNIQNLEIDKYGPETGQICAELWRHWIGQIKSLTIGGINMAKSANHFPAIDSILTGLDVGTCRNLSKKGEEEEEEIFEIEKMRTSPSILDWKNLKIFNIHFYHDDYLNGNEEGGGHDVVQEVEVAAADQGQGGGEEDEEVGQDDEEPGEEEEGQEGQDEDEDFDQFVQNYERHHEIFRSTRRWTQPVLTTVAGRYAFQMMEGVKIRLTVAESVEADLENARASLDEITPFVQIAEVVPDILKLIG